MEEVSKRIIPLSQDELRLLEWFGEWTPQVHKADWENRKNWPPGYREIADNSVNYPSKEKEDERLMRLFPLRNGLGLLRRLVEYRFLEGNPWVHVLRLTRRGRAALLYHGGEAPDGFESHTDVYDAVDLTPIVESGLFEMASPEYREHGHNAPLPDTKETWELLIREYREEEQGRRSFHCPTAHLGFCSGSRYLHGSFRQHSRYINIEVKNADGKMVCEFAMSLEGLVDLIGSQSYVPVTLDFYDDGDGVPQADLCPPPITVYDRMKARIENTVSDRDRALRELKAKIEEGNLGKNLKKELLGVLDRVMSSSDLAFRVEQAEEEIGAVVESALSIVKERLDGNPSLLGSVSETSREALGLPAHEPRG